MRTQQLLSFISILTVCLVGCVGTRFTKIPDHEIGLGHDMVQSIRTRLGKPFGEATVIKNGKTIKVLSYSFSKASFKLTGPVPNRTQAFYFYDDILVGHIYTSTEQNDQTEFDSSKVEKIKENETTSDIIVVLLSNLPEESAKDKGLSLGAADYLVKSNHTPLEVIEKVQTLLKGA